MSKEGSEQRNAKREGSRGEKRGLATPPLPSPGLDPRAGEEGRGGAPGKFCSHLSCPFRNTGLGGAPSAPARPGGGGAKGRPVLILPFPVSGFSLCPKWAFLLRVPLPQKPPPLALKESPPELLKGPLRGAPECPAPPDHRVQSVCTYGCGGPEGSHPPSHSGRLRPRALCRHTRDSPGGLCATGAGPWSPMSLGVQGRQKRHVLRSHHDSEVWDRSFSSAAFESSCDPVASVRVRPFPLSALFT